MCSIPKVFPFAPFFNGRIQYTIMDVYNEMTSPAPPHQKDSAQHDHHSHQDSHSHNHVNHCFRYLRQSLICCGDTALEGSYPNTDAASTDGTGSVRVCNEFEVIRSWGDSNRLVTAKHP